MVERNLGENCLNNESELRQFESNYQSKAATRTKALENAQGQLDAEWARNREIEAEIREVNDYLTTIGVDYFLKGFKKISCTISGICDSDGVSIVQ